MTPEPINPHCGRSCGHLSKELPAPRAVVVTSAGVAASAAQDVFELVAPSDPRVPVRAISFGQYSDAGDAQAEMLSVILMRGHTTSGSGGSSATPANLTLPG